MFDANVVTAAKYHALKEYPKECCGFVIRKEGEGQLYLPCLNAAENPYEDFAISDEDYFYAIGIGLEGVIHSHPNNRLFPSAADMESQISTGVAWGLISVENNTVSEMIYWGGDTPVPPLKGRQYVHGVTDCYSLVRDYYLLEHNIVLSDYPRDMSWWDNGKDLYTENFRNEGFEVIDPNDVRVGDSFLARIMSPVVNHSGVYVGNGMILHHLYKRLSREEPLFGWNKFITAWVRCKKI